MYEDPYVYTLSEEDEEDFASLTATKKCIPPAGIYCPIGADHASPPCVSTVEYVSCPMGSYS